jgi:hypothetical protein
VTWIVRRRHFGIAICRDHKFAILMLWMGFLENFKAAARSVDGEGNGLFRVL